jgi:hypothetical protein
LFPAKSTANKEIVFFPLATFENFTVNVPLLDTLTEATTLVPFLTIIVEFASAVPLI